MSDTDATCLWFIMNQKVSDKMETVLCFFMIFDTLLSLIVNRKVSDKIGGVLCFFMTFFLSAGVIAGFLFFSELCERCNS